MTPSSDDATTADTLRPSLASSPASRAVGFPASCADMAPDPYAGVGPPLDDLFVVPLFSLSGLIAFPTSTHNPPRSPGSSISAV